MPWRGRWCAGRRGLVLAVDHARGPARGRQQAHQRAQRGGLARAVAADQRHAAARRARSARPRAAPARRRSTTETPRQLKHGGRRHAWRSIPMTSRCTAGSASTSAGRAEGGDAALRPDRDAVGEAFDHVHVVLDEDGGDLGVAQHAHQGLDDRPSSPTPRRRRSVRPSAAGAASARPPWRCRRACARPRSAHRRAPRRWPSRPKRSSRSRASSR